MHRLWISFVLFWPRWAIRTLFLPDILFGNLFCGFCLDALSPLLFWTRLPHLQVSSYRLEILVAILAILYEGWRVGSLDCWLFYALNSPNPGVFVKIIFRLASHFIVKFAQQYNLLGNLQAAAQEFPQERTSVSLELFLGNLSQIDRLSAHFELLRDQILVSFCFIFLFYGFLWKPTLPINHQ